MQPTDPADAYAEYEAHNLQQAFKGYWQDLADDVIYDIEIYLTNF